MKILTLLFLCSIVVFAAKLTRSGSYIIDDQNKLMWQDTKDNTKISLNHKDAKKYCSSLKLGGFSNWRLPNIEEYATVIDKKRGKSQAKINKAFRNILKKEYWADNRTWLRNFGLYGYYVYFESGTTYYQNRSYLKYVRCVRSLK